MGVPYRVHPETTVIKFSVVDLSRDGHTFLLLDQTGLLHVARHVARTDGTALEREEVLLGRDAKLGNHVLMTAHTHSPMSVDFQAVGCTQMQALALLHPTGNHSPSPLH